MCASFTLRDIDRYPSWARLGTGEYLLTPRNIADIRSLYLKRPEEQSEPLASPILAPDLRDMPPALVIAAEFDPLMDEAAHYAERLRQAQVPATYTLFEGTIHSFMIMCGAISLGYSALDLVADRIASV
jgi:acetyl esterase